MEIYIKREREMDRELVVVFSLLKRARNEKKANKKKASFEYSVNVKNYIS